MSMTSCRALAVCALVSAFSTAYAADRVVSGNLVYNTDVVKIEFSVASPAKVTLWTDSWLAGLNFDPSLSVFTAGGGLLATGDDTSDPAALLPGQGGYDSQLAFASLASGHYVLTLTASGNDPLGSSLADGFSLAGTTPIRVADWNQPSYDINKNDQKGTFWQVHLAGVDAVSAVPEPTEWATMLGGLFVVQAMVRRRRRDASSTTLTSAR